MKLKVDIKSPIFWIVLLILLVLLILVFKAVFPAINKLFRSPKIVTVDSQGNQIVISDSRKKYLESLADQLHVRVQGWDGWLKSDQVFTDLKLLNDPELIYCAKYYNSTYGEKMYKAISGEILPFTIEDDVVLTNLARVGQD